MVFMGTDPSPLLQATLTPPFLFLEQWNPVKCLLFCSAPQTQALWRSPKFPRAWSLYQGELQAGPQPAPAAAIMGSPPTSRATNAFAFSRHASVTSVSSSCE